jgi:hypothetical protein
MRLTVGVQVEFDAADSETTSTCEETRGKAVACEVCSPGEDSSVEHVPPVPDEKDSPKLQSVKSVVVSRRSRLLDLPQELLDEITSYLSPAHVVILALVNKELLSRFLHMAQFMDLQPDAEGESPVPQSWKALGNFIKKVDVTKSKARGTLLSLLDSDIPDLVYCYKCKKMHGPFVTFMDRMYAPKKSYRCVDHIDHHMPPRATRKLLRCITKHRNQGLPYQDLLAQVNNTNTTYRNGIMVQDGEYLSSRLFALYSMHMRSNAGRVEVYYKNLLMRHISFEPNEQSRDAQYSSPPILISSSSTPS